MKRWARLIGLIATAVTGLGSSYYIWSFDEAPRIAIAISGLLLAAGGTATLVLLAVIASVIAEDVRPTVRFRKPAVPLSLAQRQASLVGHRNYRLHPIHFWGVLTLNNSFVFGFMLLSDPEYISFVEDTPKPPAQE